MRDNDCTDINIVETRFRASRGQDNINIELGLTNATTFNSNNIDVATGGGTAPGGTGVLNSLTGGTTPGGGSCFLGDTLFTLFDGTQIPYVELYTNKDSYKYALSFDENDTRVRGDIEDVYKNTVYEYLKVTFQDESVSKVVGEHRYYVPEALYIPIKDLRHKFVMDQDNDFVRVKTLEKIDAPEGVDAYNVSIKIYQNYCADRKRVHNLKPLVEPPD